ncbi:tRNA-dihydrouridine(20/20a) synthase [Buchnera aphidicola (Thelaxes suberi)]|uniref:tRNA dihydrouridine(20/20a) synthase DusA n=1 Tax=Buchnera aphidicola TaxID=9 RepID=UPI00346484C4
MKKLNYRFCVAPMLHYTDESCRFFYRLLTKKTILFTEMIVSKKLLYSKKTILRLEEKNYNTVVQIAGNNRKELSLSSKILTSIGYENINLNLGCPSISAQKGLFGACLMNYIPIVIDAINAIEDTIQKPISIKIRIGTNHYHNYNFLHNFISNILNKTNCKTFFIHARKAVLNNLSPKKNLKIPPIQYEYVYQIKKDFPTSTVIINGEINSIEESIYHLKKTDGVMIGRKIYQNPLLLSEIDQKIFGFKRKKYSLQSIINQYVINQTKKNISVTKILRPILGIFYNSAKSNLWKKLLNKCINEKKIHLDMLNSVFL